MPLYYTNGIGTATVWTSWVASTTSVNQVWDIWASGTGTAGAATNCTLSVAHQGRAPSPEELQEAQARMARAEAQAREREVARETATQRAREILLRYLSDEQRAEFPAGSFTVCGSHSRRLYRIGVEQRAGNVEVLNERGGVDHRLCAHDRSHGTPWPDQLLAQKLYLEHHEPEFLAVANRH